MPSLPQAKWHGRFDPNFIKSRMSALEDFINWFTFILFSLSILSILSVLSTLSIFLFFHC